MINIDFHLNSGHIYSYSRSEWKTKADCGEFFGNLVGKEHFDWPEELHEVFKKHKDIKYIHIYENQA